MFVSPSNATMHSNRKLYKVYFSYISTMKNVKISEDTWKILWKLKIEHKLKSLDEAIKELNKRKKKK